MSHGQLVYKSLDVQCVNCSAIVTQLYILLDKPITWSIAQVHISGVNSFDVRRLNFANVMNTSWMYKITF